LEYEEEIFNIIKYEFSKYLQTRTGKKTRDELKDILGNVFDLLHTRVARKKIFNILKTFLTKHSYLASHSKMDGLLQNYNIPHFREAYANKDNSDCDTNPHYLYKPVKGKGKKTGKRRISLSTKNECKIIIPRENLIYNDIKDNMKNKIYRIVDEIIRDKNIRIEIMDGLVPKSIINQKYTPIYEDEQIHANSDMNEERYIKLYKKNVSINIRHNEYGEVVRTVDDAIPEEGSTDYSVETSMKSMAYLRDKPMRVTIIGTGRKEALF
jgi:hypothetical protein